MTAGSFFNRVYEVVNRIPYGRISTYGAIASFLGTKGSSRMVGWALNSVKVWEKGTPAHRVVNRNGLLTGKRYFPGENTMKELLESEGIKVKDDRIDDFQKYFWDPSVELM